jgi:hypothetical protein
MVEAMAVTAAMADILITDVIADVIIEDRITRIIRPTDRTRTTRHMADTLINPSCPLRFFFFSQTL